MSMSEVKGAAPAAVLLPRGDEHRRDRLVWTLAILATAAIFAAGIWVSRPGSEQAQVATSHTLDRAGGSRFATEQQETIDLANTGVIPRQAVDWDAVELERLIAQGIVPGSRSPARSFTADEEAATMDLANRGVIPREAVNRDDVELRRLVNQGVVPRKALP
ncbi:MAG: hypothetical protein WB239_08625 [Acidimicrobiia bacterium]